MNMKSWSYAMVCLVGLAACEKKPVSLALTPPSLKIEQKGVSQALAVTGLDAEGNKLPVVVTWVSSDPKVVTVDAAGKITSIGSGVATVSASNKENLKGSASITVEIASAIKVEPAEIKIAKAEDKPQVVARVVNELGAPIAGKTVTFAVADATVATIEPNGVVTALKDGSTTLVATAGALKAEVKIEVAGLTPVAEPVAAKPAQPVKKK